MKARGGGASSRLIVLDRLQELKDKHKDVMQVQKNIIWNRLT